MLAVLEMALTFRRERTTRDGVACNTLPAESPSQITAEMMKCGLGCRVCIRLMIRNNEAFHTTNL
jgi:hypothetical protein